MKIKLTDILILSDGRPGHENQSFGLAEALRRRTGADLQCLRLDLQKGVLARMARARQVDVGLAKPQLLIATGHRTHLPLLLAARRFNAKSVVIMKPSLPVWLFDLCLAPLHDLSGWKFGGRILATRGSLNRLPEIPSPKTATGVILIGGPSKHHEWSGEPLVAAIKEIVKRQPELIWTVANSRRTPERFLREVAALGLSVKMMPHEDTNSGWLPSVLMEAQVVWVTEDSTSMIFEAITSRARVRLLPLPAKRRGDRVVRAVDDAVAAGFAVRYADWLIPCRQLALAEPLHEAGRCADEIVKRWFVSVR